MQLELVFMFLILKYTFNYASNKTQFTTMQLPSDKYFNM